MFNIGDFITYQGFIYIISNIDNESNTEPIITLSCCLESFEVRESELL